MIRQLPCAGARESELIAATSGLLSVLYSLRWALQDDRASLPTADIIHMLEQAGLSGVPGLLASLIASFEDWEQQRGLFDVVMDNSAAGLGHTQGSTDFTAIALRMAAVVQALAHYLDGFTKVLIREAVAHDAITAALVAGQDRTKPRGQVVPGPWLDA